MSNSIGYIEIGGNNQLSVTDVVNVARNGYRVKLSTEAEEKISKFWKLFETVIIPSAMKKVNHQELRKTAIYGVTTGFGALKSAYLDSVEKAKKIQENLVLSHATAVGEPFDDETTRAIMLIRANTLASGHCGIRVETVKRLITFLNNGILPVIPSQGSVGASGDLAPLAHLALGLIGRGPVKIEGQDNVFKNLTELLDEHAFEKDVIDMLKCNTKEKTDYDYELSFKEGLALLNGTAVMTAIATLTLYDAKNLFGWANTIASLSIEAMLGSTRAFDSIVYRVYNHDGAKLSAKHILKMLSGSKLINTSDKVHDVYSVRCTPQVHGAVLDSLKFIERQLSRHLTCLTDDPIFFFKDEIKEDVPYDGMLERYHFEAGHFHGAPIGHIMDLLCVIMTDLSSISERRTNVLLDPDHNHGLPSCLIRNDQNLNSGFMIAQYTAASLVSENKCLSHPSSVDSIPTSSNAEDHVSMATTSARKARMVVNNVYSVLAVELLCSTEALAFRTGLQKQSVEGNSHDTRMTDDVVNTVKYPITDKPELLSKKTWEIFKLIRATEKEQHNKAMLLDGNDKTIYDELQKAVKLIKTEKIDIF